MTYRCIGLRFAQGAVVWAGLRGARGRVVQQRVTWRESLGPVIEYLVQLESGAVVWCAEPDLHAEEG